MKVVKAVIEKSEDGYWAYFKNIPGCFSYGKTIDELMVNAQEAVVEYIKASKELEKALPTVLRGKFEFEYKADIQSFFKDFNFLNITAVAKKSNINPSLLRQYATGKKNPSLEQTKKIEKGIHNIAKELSIIQF